MIESDSSAVAESESEPEDLFQIENKPAATKKKDKPKGSAHTRDKGKIFEAPTMVMTSKELVHLTCSPINKRKLHERSPQEPKMGNRNKKRPANPPK